MFGGQLHAHTHTHTYTQSSVCKVEVWEGRNIVCASVHGVNDVDKLGFERRATNQEAVHILLLTNRLAVSRSDGAYMKSE